MYDEKLVLDNINLIYAVLKKLKVYHKCDEYFDVGMIGLVKGARSFNKELGFSPSTYLYRCIYHEVIQEFRKKELPTVSLSIEVNEKNTLEDIISDKNSTEDDYFLHVDNIIIEEAINDLSEHEKIVIESTYGFSEKMLTQNELSRLLGVSQPHVSRIKAAALKKLKKKLERML